MHCFLNIWEFILKRACRRATSPWLFTYWDPQLFHVVLQLFNLIQDKLTLLADEG
jgi:hypothetical protein